MAQFSQAEISWILNAKNNSGMGWETITALFNKLHNKNKTMLSIKKTFHRYKYSAIGREAVVSSKVLKKAPSEPKKVPSDENKVYKRVLVISDMHIPFHHPDTFPFLRTLNLKYKFDKIICIGDEVDYHAISFHDSNPDLPSAGDELAQSKQHLKVLYKMFPKMDIVESNHGSLVYRKALASGLSKHFFRGYNDILGAPEGWVWKFDIKINTPLGLVYFCHGKAGVAGRLASQYGMSTVQGHYHEKAQIHYIGTPEKLMYDMHIGCLADDKSLALGYNKINPKRPIVSIGIIIDGIPQIVPMVLDKGGRWNGKV
jgi:hypothetical protein